uniref:Putative RNA-directed DNA polymerase from transposon BS n=1 Tax=Lygus hesperus TaxID=30085 RepID=A0A146KN75_LYGHE
MTSFRSFLRGISCLAQFGFRKEHNTTQAVTEMVSGCLRGLDCVEMVGALLFDMSKAFDIVNLELLLLKLEFYGFDNNALSFFERYLFGWKQCVQYDGEFSNLQPLSSGVRQGSILGPLLFIVFTNDLPHAILSSAAVSPVAEVQIVMYADDVTALIKVSSARGYGLMMERVKCSISSWCRANSLVLNEDKTQMLRFGARDSDEVSVSLLGLRVDEAVTWRAHTRALAGNLVKLIFLLRRLSFVVSSRVLLAVYYGLFESRLRYGVLLWGNSSGALPIFRLQKAAIRILKGAEGAER